MWLCVHKCAGPHRDRWIWVQGHPGLYSEFQDARAAIVRLCLKSSSSSSKIKTRVLGSRLKIGSLLLLLGHSSLNLPKSWNSLYGSNFCFSLFPGKQKRTNRKVSKNVLKIDLFLIFRLWIHSMKLTLRVCGLLTSSRGLSEFVD